MANDPLWGEGSMGPVVSIDLRDWFAGMALTGLLQRKNAYKYGLDDDKLGIENAHSAYVMADKMLAERAKGKEQS